MTPPLRPPTVSEIPLHPGNARHGKQATWKTDMDNNHSDTAVSASAPAFFHIKGVDQYGETYNGNLPKQGFNNGGITTRSKAIDFENAAGKTTGGVNEDSSIR
jgi:hypothetical protein